MQGGFAIKYMMKLMKMRDFFEKKKKFFEVPKSPGNPGFFRSGPVRRALTNGPEAGMIRLKELDETG